ncbi:hypothetical protein [Winogradskyella sp. 3972H.M.0a.05]|uniref:hypothetical protein n=1 Tax=Winogradskyella sp. 3972H.M.0a.05 TaxID=2950277 RepID=UPI00339A2508
MRLLKNFRVKASSLVESIIAIVIISVCVMIAFMVYVQVMQNSHPIPYYEAKHKIQKIIQEDMKANDFENNTYKHTNYTIDKSVFINREDKIVELKFKITSGEKIYIINTLVPYDRSEN